MASETAKQILRALHTEHVRVAGERGYAAPTEEEQGAVIDAVLAARPIGEAPVRVLRLLEYVGPRDLVEKQLATQAFPGGVGTRKGWGGNDHASYVQINSTLLTQWPEALAEARALHDAQRAQEIEQLRGALETIATGDETSTVATAVQIARAALEPHSGR